MVTKESTNEVFHLPQISSNLMKTSLRNGERGGSISKYITICATQATETINLFTVMHLFNIIINNQGKTTKLEKKRSNMGMRKQTIP